MLDFSQFEILSFDCYGTLIDWESGILGCLRPLLAAHGQLLEDASILALYATLESEIEQGSFLPYRQVLEQVVRGFGRSLGFAATESEAHSLPESIAAWPPFPDSVLALAQLKTRYRLAALSNVDDDLFSTSAKLLGNPFDLVVTAQQVGSYKPALNNFRALLGKIEHLGVEPRRVLHVAQSLYHDIAPAHSLGLATVWVNRRAGREGSGATPPATVLPDLVVPDLAALVAAIPGLR